MDENSKFLESRKVQLVLITAAMALIPMCLMAAMVLTGKATSHEWAELSWKLFAAGIGAPSTAAIVMRGVEGAASQKRGRRADDIPVVEEDKK
jgi:hypothetical protein